MMKKKNTKQWKDLKPFEKFIGYGIGIFIVIALVMGFAGAFGDIEAEVAEKEVKQEQAKKEREEKKIIKDKENAKVEAEKEEKKQKELANKKEKEKTEEEDEVTWDDLKDKDKIIRKSNKDFSDISKSKPSDVRNDVTGNWKVITMSKSVDVVEYAISYQDLHMKEDEVHFIVNFSYNTTTWLNELGGLLYVDIRERIDKEEHDADKLGSGMVLKSYRIYPDGDIEEIEQE